MAHQSITVPLIEWGSLALLLGIVLSPFLIIRLSVFRPTRWWHIVGAYFSSFLVFFVVEYVLASIDQWVAINVFTTWELNQAYDMAGLRHWLFLILAYPLLLFYSVNMLYNSFTRGRFYTTLLVAVLFLVVMVIVVGYVSIALLGQALTEHL